VADYNPQEIEAKWQKRWEEARVFETEADPSKPKYYTLEMLPYPSGTMHMGHMRNYAIGDVVARVKRMRGFNVLHPMGWDAFGLPAENAAIKNNTHPRVWTNNNIGEFQRTLRRFGFSYDWRREISTCEPEYYRWNQWFFLRMLERGLAYRKKSRVNWCPKCCTVLANEQVINGGYCWRHEDTLVESRELEQWFLKITAYADQLVDDLKQLESTWPERVITMQRNWIGRSQGARVKFEIADLSSVKPIEIFTTRIDTIYGASAIILAPTHPLVPRLLQGSPVREQAEPQLARMRQTSVKTADLATAEKVGFFSGRHATNPFSGEKIPIWVGNFVLMEYGTGAIMAVPAHDQRDFEFCRKYGLPIRVVIQPSSGEPLVEERMTAAFDEHQNGWLVNSGSFNGLSPDEAIAKMTAFAEKKDFGHGEVVFRLRDWGISRQRYWGTPIPVVYCADHGLQAVPDKDLPVLLPPNPKLTGEGESPLASTPEFVNTICPKCGGSARRETDTMDTFVDSSWYFYRYCVPKVEPLGPPAGPAGPKPPSAKAPGAVDDRELVRRAQGEDQEAFEELLRRHQHRVFAVAGGILRRREDVEDIAQQVFVKAYFSLKRFDQRAAFSTWLYKITVNECWDLLRKKKVRPLVYESDLSEEQAKQVIAAEGKNSSGPDISDRFASLLHFPRREWPYSTGHRNTGKTCACSRVPTLSTLL